MSAPFVTSLRTRGDAIALNGAGREVVHIRVEVPELWETVRVDATASEAVVAVKTRALQALAVGGTHHQGYVVKLNGFEILNEHASLAEAGVLDGSTLLITGRRRRPVR